MSGSSHSQRVVLETDAFVVINKLPSTLVHNEPGVPAAADDGVAKNGEKIEAKGEREGIINLLRKQLDDKALFPVHRLDRDTSGILLVAKGKQATKDLSLLFQNREIQKYYWALCDKKTSKKQGSVVGDMEKSRNGSWKLSRKMTKPAATQFFSYGLEGGVRAVLLKPHTGKTHQIRVALKSLGAAVLGDERYGGAKSDRMYLHATRMLFILSGHEYDIEVKPDNGALFMGEAFKDLYQRIGRPDALSWPKLKL